jgi:Protein of unknown function (DUF3800)
MTMSFEFYADDSGSEPQSPIFFFAGLLTAADDRAAFSDEWNAALARHPKLDYFKMSEAASLRGQFEQHRGWNDQKRDDRVITLARIATKYARLRASVSIRHDLFDKYFLSVPAVERNLATDTPYVLLFTQMISVALLHANYQGMREKIDFIFDQQCGFSDEAVRHWPLFKFSLETSLRPDLLQMIGGTPFFQDEKDFLPLQAADLYAWQARNHYVENHRVQNQTVWVPMNNILRMFSNIPSFHRAMKEEELTRQHKSLLETCALVSKTSPNIRLIPPDNDIRERKRIRRRARRVARLMTRK